jgi:hypothetical protein
VAPSYAADSNPPATAAEKAGTDGWLALFDGKNLDAWRKPAAEKWKIIEGTLAGDKGCGNLWSKDTFGDFVLDLEVKCAKNTNSGVYLRGPVQYWHGLEIQVFRPVGRSKPGKHDMGALYDCVAPKVAAEKPLGEWNHFVITFVGNRLKVVLNDQPIIDADLNRWKDLHKNPDGSPNKFDWRLKDLPKTGRIGFQDHGTPVWYRNVRIKPLGGAAPAAAEKQ